MTSNRISISPNPNFIPTLFALAATVDICVGCNVVGAAVGDKVGNVEGDAVGDEVGNVEGDAVGDEVGHCDGNWD